MGAPRASPLFLSKVFHWLCYSLWLFHLHGAVKIQPFSPVFPMAGATAKTLCWLSLWNFKESISHFLWCSLFKKFILDSCHAAFIANVNVSLPEVYCMRLDVWTLGRVPLKRSPSSLLPSSQCRGKGPPSVAGGHSPFRWFLKALLYMWLFHLHSAVKNRALFPVFPLAGSTAKAFFQLSLWSFKEKNINHFL